MLCLIGLQSNGQAFKFLFPSYPEVDEAKGFIVKDKIYTQGFLYFNPNKPGKVDYSSGRRGTLTTYTAEELTEFGIDDSRTSYVAKTIMLDDQLQRVFLRVIVKDSLFYLHRNRTFFRNSGSLEPLTQQELLPFLQSLSAPGAKWNKELHLFKLKQQPLQYFARNNAEGKSPTVLFTNGGLFLSFNASTLTPTGPTINKAKHKLQQATSGNISVGVFADLPVWSLNNISFYTQLSYGKMRFNETIISRNSRYDTKLDLDFLRLALQPKYTLSFSKLRVFAQAGPTLMYNLKHDRKAFESVIKGNKVSVAAKEGFAAKQAMLGVEAGVGISYFYLPKHYLALHFSQSKNFSKYLNISNQSFTVSANL